MLGIHHYWLFIATAVVLVLTPGQDTFFILGRSIASGRSAGIAAALGITVGSIGHTLLAALGLSALLATSPYAFTVVKFAGAAYLFYIGVRALLSRSNGLPGADANAR
jgi:threonine/homoserine/homoserine lactone efflux protein